MRDYTYDESGKVIRLLNMADGVITEHTFQYNPQGKPIKEFVNGKLFVTNTYDESGKRILQRLYSFGFKQLFNYKADGFIVVDVLK